MTALSTDMCIATVVTEDFVPGALVTFHSFKKQNKWFRGDFVVIHDGLSDESQDVFRSLFDTVRFITVSDDLSRQIDCLTDFRPDIHSRRPRFYSIECFHLREYSKVLFVDSDLLFRGDISELWKRSEPLICCRDRPAYLNRGRDSRTFALCEKSETSLNETFNAGFLLIDDQLLNDTEYQGLLNMIAPRTWEKVTASHTDQLVLNHYFAGRQHLVDGRYNYLLTRTPMMKEIAGIRPADAVVLHFNPSTKPWQMNKLATLNPRSPEFFEALRWWNEAWGNCLQESFFRRRLNHR